VLVGMQVHVPGLDVVEASPVNLKPSAIAEHSGSFQTP
jgi:hypothetical protein